MLEFARAAAVEVRFIEYMDVGGATGWRPERVFSRDDILARIEQAGLGPVRQAPRGRSSAPADRYVTADGTSFGIIASTTQPFCGTCDRARLTADGVLYLCLYARSGLDLRSLLRRGAKAAELRGAIAAAWGGRRDRGAEERVGLAVRQPLARADELRRDPHLEMHTRGG
jgi:cyclic pyranopterin phosphate synthase